MGLLILKSEISKGIDGETALLNTLDVGTQFLLAHPVVRRTGNAAYRGITRAYGGRCGVQCAYIDGARELIEACDMHGIPHECSAPYIHENNAVIES